MREKTVRWTIIVIILGIGLAFNWDTALYVEARPPAVPRRVPLQQTCQDGPDLQIQSWTIEPERPAPDQPYQVHVEIINAGTITGTVNSVTGIYMGWDENPGNPPDIQNFANTEDMETNDTIVSHLTVPADMATVGFHYFVIGIDVEGDITEGCGGEGNNFTEVIEVEIPADATPTPEPPTPTPFPPPQIYFFEPGDITVAVGDSFTLHWQAYGEAMSVYLDGELVPVEDTQVIYPTESRVYTLRAENPGGVVERTCRITVVEPTATPTITPTPCELPTIHDFNATSTNIPRGSKTTLYWDLSGADNAYLNGDGVPGVSEKTVKLERTTTYILVARNACGEVEKSLTIKVRYTTPTPTRTPTRTPTPTRTSTPTRTPRPPTSTPTRNILPTPTEAPTRTGAEATPTSAEPSNTITPNVTRTPSSPFESPLEPPEAEATFTLTTTVVMKTAMATPTETPPLTRTAEPSVTPAPDEATATPPPADRATATASTRVVQAPTATEPIVATCTVQPLPTSTVIPPVGTMRMYLCPLGILIVFAAGVLVLSIVLPQIRERRQAQETLPLSAEDTVFNPDEPLSEQELAGEEPFLPVAQDEEFEPAAPPTDEELFSPIAPDEEFESAGLLPDNGQEITPSTQPVDEEQLKAWDSVDVPDPPEATSDVPAETETPSVEE